VIPKITSASALDPVGLIASTDNVTSDAGDELRTRSHRRSPRTPRIGMAVANRAITVAAYGEQGSSLESTSGR
jgi:hypothetical protein